MIYFEQSTDLYCLLQLKIRPIIYIFFGVAFMPIKNCKRNLRGQLFVLTIPGAWSLQYHWNRQVVRMKAEFCFQNDRRTGELHSLTPTAHICRVWGTVISRPMQPCYGLSGVCIYFHQVFGMDFADFSWPKSFAWIAAKRFAEKTLWGCLGEMWLEWPFENVRGTRFISQMDSNRIYKLLSLGSSSKHPHWPLTKSQLTAKQGANKVDWVRYW